uniref:Uncharacterized protein n=1 Tax=Tanacetum cinerariifolium TaxID=118510 RepID=A0A6L2LVR9_TANCI|nr:hypothetical protein [Tanacetum cinerariifolium]
MYCQVFCYILVHISFKQKLNWRSTQFAKFIDEHFQISCAEQSINKFFKFSSWSTFEWRLVIDPCVLAILKGSFDPVNPFIRQTAKLGIT